MKNILLFSLCVLFFGASQTQGQDTLLFLDGRRAIVNNFRFDDLDSELILFENEKGKTKGIYSYDLFSATPSGEEEIIFYDPAQVKDGPTVPEMRRFVYGEIDANKRFKPRFATISGFLVGAASPFIFGNRAKYSLSLPIVYGIGIGRSMPNTPKFVSEHLANSDKYYMLGYTEIIRRKRTGRALLAGGVGWALSFFTILIVNETR